MKHLKSFAISRNMIVVFLVTTALMQSSKSQTLNLYRDSYKNGTLELDVNDNCTESLPSTFLESFSYGNLTVDCARFYSHEGCAGHSVEIRKDSLDHLPWPLQNIKSFGPCETISEKCLKSTKRIFTVELFDQKDWKGHLLQMILKPTKMPICYVLPIKIKRKVSSIRLRADDCVELHANNDCSDIGIMIQMSSPGVGNLVDWGFDDKTSSISVCNEQICRNENFTKYKVKSNYNPAPKCPHITLFDEEDFKGNTKHVVVQEECVNFDGKDWEGVAESIILYQECVIVYNLIDCGANEDVLGNSSGIHSTQLNWVNKNETGFNLKKFRMDGHVRSIGPCVHRIPPHQFISIYLLAGLFLTGIIVAGCVNGFVKKRDKKERQTHIYYDKPV